MTITFAAATALALTLLPAPTGPHPIGLTTLHLVDSSRTDPWVPESGARQLMVSLWYPAKRAVGEPAPYVTKEESAAILATVPGMVIPPDTLAKTETHARVDAPVLRREGRLPLVIVSPGQAFPRATMTSLSEDLASRGYLVAAVEHTYESVATTFPDGHTTTCVACPGNTEEKAVKMATGRAADISFVLDQLERKPWGRLIDRSRIGMVGMSAGGNAVSYVLDADPRVKVGVNLDGSFNPKVPVRPVTKPFLMFGTEDKHRPQVGSWDLFWPHVTGAKRWLTLSGSDHATFTDYAVLRPQLGLPSQSIEGTRAVQATRDHVASFLDEHLRGGEQELPAGYPEVKVWN